MDAYEEVHAAPHGRMAAWQAVRPESFEHASGDVRTGGIQHGVVIRERHVAQETPVIVRVESRPAAVARLHIQQPIERAPLARLLRRAIVGARLGERQQDHGGIVYIGIKIVVVFECPTGGRGVGALHGPIAFAADLALEQPLGGARQGGMIRLALSQRVRGDGGVPDRREARLKEKPLAIIHHQVVELAHRLHSHRIVFGVAQPIQRHHRIHHGRIDRAQTVGVFQPRHHPLLGLPDGPPPDGFRSAAFPPFEAAVYRQKQIAPGD